MMVATEMMVMITLLEFFFFFFFKIVISFSESKHLIIKRDGLNSFI